MKSYIKPILLCSLIIACSPLSESADEIADLESKTSSLSSQLENINQEMVEISDDISSTKNQIEIIHGEILRTQDSLAAAQEDEAQRYQDMKTRIKYMYEVGNSSLLEMLFSAESMSDFLNKAEFIETISSYDRNMLDQLQSIREEIAEREQVLLNQQTSLEGLQNELEQRRVQLNETAVATSTDLAVFNAQLTQLREEKARREAEEALRAAQAAAAGIDTYVNIDLSTVTAADVDVFAAILECEAIQDHDSLLAVATVIMNRMYSSLFPNTIKEIVYADGQFEPVWTGRLETVLSRGASDLSYQVAQEALDGARLASVADCYYFLYAGATDRGGVNVGNNLFFRYW